MGNFPSHIPKPTAEQRDEMFALMDKLAKKNGYPGLGFPEEFLAVLYSDDYVPPNMDKEVVILTVVVMFFLVASISLRFYSRYRYGAKGGPMMDDWLVLISTLFCIAYAIVNLYAFLWAGFGRFSYDLTLDQFNHCLKLFIVNFTTFAIANTAVKVSVLVLYRRIFDSVQTDMRRVVYGLIAFVLVFCPVSLLAQISSCKPLIAFWHLEVQVDPATKCNTGAVASYVIGAIRTLLDVIIFALPLKHIWDIKYFTRRKKIAITVIFMLGLVACIASILKLVFYRDFLVGDVTRGIFKAVVAEALEYTSAIVAACVPALLPMIKSMYRNTSSAVRQITSGGKSQNQSTTTHVAAGPVNHNESIKMKGIKISHAVSQTVEIHREEDDTQLILRGTEEGDERDDKDSKTSYTASANRSQTSV
ncbi:hypothetical protein DRE_04473 [Drechslerella stenobrocha 248]|uniref:Rhodopsin domain-containing protein n=1 Tax=Drechslerella stenobrocha 248 TaxID=1043628 RepID=W7I1A3_9PEZI|nr:hypothetical protein DRE_04473 [Drechslerella stenobrocha 248]